MPPRRSSARQNATPTVAGASSEPLGGANGWSGLQAPVAVMGTQNPGAAILQEQQAAGQSGSLETPSETQALSSTSSAPPRRTSRFKPKATPRQSQQERERLERIERVRVTQAAVKKATEERRAQRAQASQPAHRGGAKSSVFRGRGSGTFVGREANRSSGPFGGGYVLSMCWIRTGKHQPLMYP